MWFSAIKMAVSAGSHIYKKRQETKMRMADAQYLHAEKMARGEEQYQGKLLEARRNCPFDSYASYFSVGVWSMVRRSRSYGKDQFIF